MSNPAEYIEDFVNAGADTLIIHTEASANIARDLEKIKNLGVKCGLAIKPKTDESILAKYVDIIDYILVMSVEPGFGGQSFIEQTLVKMENIVNMTKGKNILVGVDGGVNLKTIDRVYETGVDVTIVGSGLYKAENIEKTYLKLIDESS